MLVTPKGLAAGTKPAGESDGGACTGAEAGDGRQPGFGVQEWPDGSRYEGEFVDGFKHGSGRYSWRNGEVSNVCAFPKVCVNTVRHDTLFVVL